MVKKLAALGYVTHVRYRGVRLTDEGRKVALEVLRHHRLLETYLVEELGVPWDRVHAEAEVLEHVLSEGLEERIAAKLGEPTHDPHGDPIPARGRHRRRAARRAGRPRRRATEDGSSASPTATRSFFASSPIWGSAPATSSRSWPEACAPGRTRTGSGPLSPGRCASRSRPVNAGDPFLAARDLLGRVLPGEAATIRAAQEALDGERHGLRALWPFLGPAFIASVAYVDPGNFATDVAGGAKFGYLLLWAVLGANLMAMLVQTLSAKLGIATGRNLAEVCRDNFSRRVSFGLWLQAEVIAMATDLAEVLGAALGLSLLFGIPLGWGAVIAVAAAFTILLLQASGFRQLEAVIAVFVGVIVARSPSSCSRSRPTRARWPTTCSRRASTEEALLLAVGIIGATVMPHVIYLHSALTQSRVRGQDRGGAEAHPALRADRRADRDVDRRPGQPGDALDLRRPLLRDGCGVDRGRVPRPARAIRAVGGHAARRRPARVRPLVVVGRHARRARS